MNRIRLPRAGTENVYLSLYAKPAFSSAATVEVSFEGSGIWVPATVTGTAGVLTAQILIAGPLATVATGTPVIGADSTFRVRVTDGAETILRGGGFIALVN